MVTRETATGSAFGTALSTLIVTIFNHASTAPFSTTDSALLIGSGGVVIGGLIGEWRSWRAKTADPVPDPAE